MSIAVVERLEQKNEPELRDLVGMGAAQSALILRAMIQCSRGGINAFTREHPLGKRLLALGRVRATIRDIWIEKIREGLGLNYEQR